MFYKRVARFREFVLLCRIGDCCVAPEMFAGNSPSCKFYHTTFLRIRRVDAKLLEEVQEYDAVPSEAASYGENAFWDERYASDEEVRNLSLTTLVSVGRTSQPINLAITYRPSYALSDAHSLSRE